MTRIEIHYPESKAQREVNTAWMQPGTAFVGEVQGIRGLFLRLGKVLLHPGNPRTTWTMQTNDAWPTAYVDYYVDSLDITVRRKGEESAENDS